MKNGPGLLFSFFYEMVILEQLKEFLFLMHVTKTRTVVVLNEGNGLKKKWNNLMSKDIKEGDVDVGVRSRFLFDR